MFKSPLSPRACAWLLGCACGSTAVATLAETKPAVAPVKRAPTGNVAIKAGPVPNLAAPDLKVMSWDGSRAKVKNVGTADAVASKSTTLLVGGDSVPSGGRIAVQQEVTSQVSVLWDCDASTVEQTAGRYRSWPESYGPRPTDAAGHDLLAVDPSNGFAESNEQNNATLPIVRTNPIFNSEGKLPDLVVTAPRVWLDGEVVRFEWTDKNQGGGAAQFCDPTSQPGSPSYIGTWVYRVEIDGTSTPLNSTFLSAPWTAKSGEEKKAWHHKALQKLDQYGVSNGGLQPGCHEFKFIVDPDNRIKEANECNNASVLYFATGGAQCGADKKPNSPSTCPKASLAPAVNPAAKAAPHAAERKK